MKKVLSLLLVLCMVMGLAACGNRTTDTPNAPTNTPTPTSAQNPTSKPGDPTPTDAPATPTPVPVEKFEGSFIFKDSVSTLASNWNTHTYQTSDDSYPLDFTTSSLYSIIFNDANHPVEGKDLIPKAHVIFYRICSVHHRKLVNISIINLIDTFIDLFSEVLTHAC